MIAPSAFDECNRTRRARKLPSLLLLLLGGIAVGCGGAAGERPHEVSRTLRIYEGPSNEAEVQRVAGIDDQEFLRRAASGGMFEIQSSQHVLDLTATSDTETLAIELIDDHETIRRELRALADKKGWTVPDEMLPSHRQMLTQIREASPASLEERYLRLQRQAHDEAILLYDRCSKLCLDSDLRMFASTTLLMLRDHFDEVHDRR